MKTMSCDTVLALLGPDTRTQSIPDTLRELAEAFWLSDLGGFANDLEWLAKEYDRLHPNRAFVATQATALERQLADTGAQVEALQERVEELEDEVAFARQDAARSIERAVNGLTYRLELLRG